jgi:hypothetical protein
MWHWPILAAAGFQRHDATGSRWIEPLTAPQNRLVENKWFIGAVTGEPATAPPKPPLPLHPRSRQTATRKRIRRRRLNSPTGVGQASRPVVLRAFSDRRPFCGRPPWRHRHLSGDKVERGLVPLGCALTWHLRHRALPRTRLLRRFHGDALAARLARDDGNAQGAT